MKNVKNLKCYKKALMLIMAGSIGVCSSGCKGGQTYSIISSKVSERNVENNLLRNDNVFTHNDDKKTNIDKIVLYEDNIYAYLKNNISIRKSPSKNSKKIKKVGQYQKVKLLADYGKWELVKYNNKTGYIKDKNLSKLKSDFIEVDISEQKLKYYNKKGNVKIKSSVVTGLAADKSRETVLGCYKIYSKETNRNLRGANYVSHVDWWMPFYEGYGLHDADWRGSFGGNIYKYNGSHGCVNLPEEVASKIYKKAKVGTKVLIHK